MIDDLCECFSLFIILTLYDTGVRAAELRGMGTEDIDWRIRTIFVTGKADKQRRVSIGNRAAQGIERYLRKRGVKSEWLWLASGSMPLTINGLRMKPVLTSWFRSPPCAWTN